jgi:lipid A 3-O-deacylase
MGRAAALVSALFAAAPVLAVDGASFETGRGNEGTEMWRAGIQWNWERRWFTERSWNLRAYWDLQLGRWRGPLKSGQLDAGDQEVWDLGLTPVFRLERAGRTAFWPYFEAAVGFHLLSDLNINFQRRFSTSFQYGDHIGAGIRFGPDYHIDMSLRLQHLSNGGLARPNPGINFLQARLMYHF